MATNVLLNWALEQYAGMSSDDDTGDWTTPACVRQFAIEEAGYWLTGYYEAADTDEEMFPSYVALVSTPAIEKTIDWELISKSVRQKYFFGHSYPGEEDWKCDDCGDTQMDEITTCDGKALCPSCEAKSNA